MFDADKWHSLVTGAACPVCRNPPHTAQVANLPSGSVVLQNDADFPGYCILYHRRHVTELNVLSPDERRAWVEDVARVATAIQEVCRPLKLNYAALGNLVPHFHVHVIPRYPTDGYWGQPIWNRPDHLRRELPSGEFQRLYERLREKLLTA